MANRYGTPFFVYDEERFSRAGNEALSIPNAFGLTVRYAMKANPHSVFLRFADSMGICIDASSYYEVRRALAADIAGEKIMLTSQEVLTSERLEEIISCGVVYNCTSLTQLRQFAKEYGGTDRVFSVRINPGLGSGHNNRTNTGGPSASFGIWHEYLPEVRTITSQNSLTISRIHTHVGSGSDWQIWQKAARMTLDVVRTLPDVNHVSLGGGYKIDRMNPHNSINLSSAFLGVKESFEMFYNQTGRKLHLEIEPGTYLIANAGVLIATISDRVDTGVHGYTFLKIDASMTELVRPMMYGAHHPIRLLGKGDQTKCKYVVVGSCCESGDIFTPKEYDPEGIDTVALPEAAIGDCIAIMGAGAYSNSMSIKNYNSRPQCAEVLLHKDDSHSLITRRQEIEDVWGREMEGHWE